ncbi:hypothetical protein GWC95_16225 [Sediminibacterium roseum]|uniref:Uncharacterized protein n=1 Tax=Sediminibacterium roseum TaxID=1978412 RepID=A0ABX0A0K9_9BACT|nr:hypothetical protein [Sediminibacterium roseum]NCI51477.1 hypothetical protein [Sediminibacterium roseum]
MSAKKTPAPQPKTKTTVNKTAALRAADANKTTDTKRSSSSTIKSKPPVVKDIDEASPDRR